MGHSGSTVSLRAAVLANTQRAGLSNFGSTVSIEGSHFECTTFALNGQNAGANLFTISDLGGNGCGCQDDYGPCKVLTAELEPPAPLGSQ